MRHNKKMVLICIVLTSIVFILICNTIRIDKFGFAQIHWVECVKINNIKYYSDYDRSAIEYSSIGKKIGEVKFNVSQNVHNSMYRFRNGDATFLDIGTEIYNIKSDSNAIAVKINNQYYIYKADTQ